jgi:hypothetical protein
MGFERGIVVVFFAVFGTICRGREAQKCRARKLPGA